MGVQALMSFHNKRTVSIVTRASGTAIYPGFGVVSTVSILPAADLHRIGEVERCVMYCLEYARDNNIFVSSGSISIVTTLDGGKNGIVEIPIATNVITGHVGIMITGTVRDNGGTLITYEAHRQCLDAMREQGRLAA